MTRFHEPITVIVIQRKGAVSIPLNLEVQMTDKSTFSYFLAVALVTLLMTGCGGSRDISSTSGNQNSESSGSDASSQAENDIEEEELNDVSEEGEDIDQPEGANVADGPDAGVIQIEEPSGNPDIDVSANEFNDFNIDNYPGEVNSNGVNIRSYPSTASSSNIVGTKNIGDQVVVTAFNNQWDKIYWHSNQHAYVFSSFVDQTSSALSVSDRIQILGFKGKCVEAPELQNGTTLVMRTCTGEKKQEWIPRNSGELVSAENTNFCIDLAGPSNDNGADAQVWRCNGNCNNQGWFFDRTASGHKRLISQYNSKCVDIKDNSTAEGAPLQMWVCNPQRCKKSDCNVAKQLHQ